VEDADRRKGVLDSSQAFKRTLMDWWHQQDSASVEVKLDHLIPQEKWEITGLNELTAPEHQPSANGITGLLAAAQSNEISTSAQSDRSQWRRLQRRMSKEDVRKLLGEPTRISVSRFYEAWDYPRGTVIFDGKGSAVWGVKCVYLPSCCFQGWLLKNSIFTRTA
jgi:hypothetical protein